MNMKDMLKTLYKLDEAGANAGAGPYEPSGMFADDDAPTAPGQNPEYDKYVASVQAQGKKPHYDDFISSKGSNTSNEKTTNTPTDSSDK